MLHDATADTRLNLFYCFIFSAALSQVRSEVAAEIEKDRVAFLAVRQERQFRAEKKGEFIDTDTQVRLVVCPCVRACICWVFRKYVGVCDNNHNKDDDENNNAVSCCVVCP